MEVYLFRIPNHIAADGQNNKNAVSSGKGLAGPHNTSIYISPSIEIIREGLSPTQSWLEAM
jgi:hypothetical protein